MSGPKTTKLLMGKAYQVFVDEIGKHLIGFETSFQSDSTLTKDELYRISAAFHTIKGGAGFFGLSEIAQAAGALENLFNRPGLDLLTEKEKIEELYKVLKQASKQMPAPQKEAQPQS